MTRLDGGMADPGEESSLERLLGSTLTEAQRELLRQMSASEEGQELPVLLTEEDRTLAAEFVAEQQQRRLQRRLVADEERRQRELADRWELWEWSDAQDVDWGSTPAPLRRPVTW